ncbi:MAG: T9SS type A sorting domain-containing protein [Taibaiella sp.]|nr:T9SS type A sorting domain-containing protein [Taibaiella sp.]
MVKKALLLLTAVLGLASTTHAQFCGTVKEAEAIEIIHPEVATYRADLERQIQAQLRKMDLSKLSRTTAAGDTVRNIPVVVHVIHDYGVENVSDAAIYTMLKNINDFYNLRNDTSQVVPEFKKYVGNAKFNFALATKDPSGNRTKGITRTYSYLTYGKDDQAKIGQWSPASYMNIWVESFIGQGSEGGGIVAAYAVEPPTAAADPYVDGIMTNSQFITTTGNNDGATIPHEIGHYFNLSHTFGPYNFAGPALKTFLSGNCASTDDFVDDTPPTFGQEFTCDLNDTSCQRPYFKVYASSVPGVDSLVDYPDTENTQNIMNYASCKNMFTKGQVARMHAALHSNIASRNHLIDSVNQITTGVNLPIPDLKPNADFSVVNSSFVVNRTNATHFFLCSGQTFYFRNQSWNDTVSSVTWKFNNNSPATPTITNTGSAVVSNTFSGTGWASVSLIATSNAGIDTLTRDSAVYVASNTSIPALGYFEEFNQSGGDLDKWPLFNYYKNSYKWEFINNNGFYDKNCVRYDGFDTRTPGIETITGTPQGDFDDMYTPAFDLSGSTFSGNCNLNFMYAGTYITSNSYYLNDTLEIDYSTDCGQNWPTLKNLTKAELSTIGSQSAAFAPASMADWRLRSINIPAGAKTSKTFFRFRYKPGTFSKSFGSGNYFYLDRFNVSNDPLGLNTLLPEDRGVIISPNPTNGNAFVLIKESTATTAHLTVTDLTGKVVYTTQQAINGTTTRIEIPASYIGVKGMYMVQVQTGDQVRTEKLVVY